MCILCEKTKKKPTIFSFSRPLCLFFIAMLVHSSSHKHLSSLVNLFGFCIFESHSVKKPHRFALCMSYLVAIYMKVVDVTSSEGSMSAIRYIYRIADFLAFIFVRVRRQDNHKSSICFDRRVDIGHSYRRGCERFCNIRYISALLSPKQYSEFDCLLCL